MGDLILEKGTRNTSAQTAAGGNDRLPGDHGGHLIGTRFLGSGELDNIVAQNGNVNLSGYKIIENEWDRALKAGKEVYVDIKPKYEGINIRPTSFEIYYRIDGIEYFKELKNEKGAK